MSDLSALAARFRRFAADECGSSPLYRRLAMGIAGDGDLLALADQGTGGPKPNLILAAVQYLLLSGRPHALAAFYPSITDQPLPAEEAVPPFREFCLGHAEEIRGLITSRRVQTNEVARAALLLPAFAVVSESVHARPLGLVEVGASAGLLLSWDRYAFDYGTGGLYGAADSPVLVRCELRGDGRPPLPSVLPAVTSRTGIDLHPIDPDDPDQALWLRARLARPAGARRAPDASD